MQMSARPPRHGVSYQPRVLQSFIVNAVGYAFLAAELRNTVFTSQVVQHNEDLLFGRILLICSIGVDVKQSEMVYTGL